MQFVACGVTKLKKKPVIIFVSAVFPNQFTLLCDYLNEAGLGEAYCLTTPGNVKKWGNKHANLLAFQPDGAIVGPQSYYYSSKVERSARISRGLLEAVRELGKTKKIDLIVAHVLWGCPYFLFDEFEIPIISYIEFPSYRHHGWDDAYPPDQSQRVADSNMEMLSFYCAARSAGVIVPSQYAKLMLPSYFHHKVYVQLEGFRISAPKQQQKLKTEQEDLKNKIFTVGFAARDLSSSKGFDKFMEIAHRAAEHDLPIEFVAIGSDRVSTYGYERQFVERFFDSKDKGFVDYLRLKFPKAQVQFCGLLAYKEYLDRLDSIDLFLYPLRHGVANWGLVELLIKGRPIIATRTAFIPELISDGLNGKLIDPSASTDTWIEQIMICLTTPGLLTSLSVGAQQGAARFSIELAARGYMKIFRQVCKEFGWKD